MPFRIKIVATLVLLVGALTGISSAVTTPRGVDSFRAFERFAPELAVRLGAGADGGGFYDQQLASALRNASLYEAQADAWRAMARCLTVSDPAECLQEAQDEFQEAIDLANEQYDARRDIGQILGGSVMYEPDIDPADFSPNITNPYLPYVVGRTLVYESQTPEGLETIEVTAMNETRDIDGVTCRVVRDVVRLDGDIIEDTIDWIAQKSDGSVWYFGEIALNYEDGFLTDIDGSWKTGEDGAQPGILMPAVPAVGQAYRQEFRIGEAEDLGYVISTTATATTPLATYQNCVQTADITPLEPGVTEHKFYASGIGLVKETKPGSGEVVELVQIINN